MKRAFLLAAILFAPFVLLRSDTNVSGNPSVNAAQSGTWTTRIVGAAGTTLDGASAGVIDVNVKNVNNTATLATASVGSNVVAFTAKRNGTTLMAPQYFASHITSKTTTTPVASTCYVSSIAISVTSAGSSQTLVIQNKEATPKVLYTAGTAIGIGNTYINFTEPILMTSGIDIVSAGTTAGTQDVFITCWQ